MIQGVQGVNWSAPWLAPLRRSGIEIAAAKDWLAALNSQAEKNNLRNHINLPIRFIPQHELPEGISYEAHISATGQVPTRQNWHDFFNGLIWLAYPGIKVQLNALQAKQIAQSVLNTEPGPALRGATRDAATLFDENAAILAVSDTPEGREIADALRKHQWTHLFIQQRCQFVAHAKVYLFGHAIIEKLMQPYKAITAHSVICWVEPGFHVVNDQKKREIIDQQIAEQLKHGQELTPALFSPLPVLGVPGWWSDQTPDFYDDAHVFRPVRQKSLSQRIKIE